MCGGSQRLVVRAQPQILGRQVGVDHFVRIHPVVGIPRRLEFAESLHQFRPEHFRQQRAARLPVAMLAGKRAAVAHHQIRGALDELAILANARLAVADRS